MSETRGELDQIDRGAMLRMFRDGYPLGEVAATFMVPTVDVESVLREAINRENLSGIRNPAAVQELVEAVRLAERRLDSVTMTFDIGRKLKPVFDALAALDREPEVGT